MHAPRFLVVMAASLAAGAALAAAALLPTGCGGDGGTDAAAGEVVVYTALDQVHSEPLLKAFQERTGIRVRPVYDTEDAKTTGLVNRLIARRAAPDADVLWNNEILQTVRLARMDLLEPYASPQAARFPARWRDPAHRWTAFAARLRVVIVNTQRVPPDGPQPDLAAFADPARGGQAAVARPFFGTTLTHMVILHQQWGPERLAAWLAGLRAAGTALCPGNGAVRDMVADGQRAFGLTDTDDAYAAMQAGKPVRVLVPAGEAVLIPNTVSLVKGGPNAASARRLIDYLLSAEVERALARGASAQIPLASDLAGESTPWNGLVASPAAPVDLDRAADAIPEVVELLRAAGMDR
jgi:iron(III) transport system substrate-binding protein